MLRDSLIYALARGIPAIINFAALALYTRLLSSGEYGEYIYVLALAGLVSASLFWWLRLSVTRILPSYHEASEHAIFMGVLIRFYIQLLGILGVALIAGLIIFNPPLKNIILASYPLLASIVVYELLLEVLRSNMNPKIFGFVSIIKSILMTFVGGALAYYGWGALGLIIGGIVGHTLACLIGVRWIPRGYINYAKDKEIQRKLFSYGIPLAISFGFTVVLAQSDRLLITWLMDTEAAGVYAAPYDLTWQSLGIIANIIGLSTFPKIVTVFERQGKEAVREQLAQCMALLCAVVFPASLGFYLVAPSFVSLMLGEEFRTAAIVLMPWIIGGSLLEALKTYYFDYAFHLSKKTLYQTFVLLVAAVVNIILNILMIPHYGIIGAAYATVIAYMLALGLSFWLGQRVFRLPVPARPFVHVLIGTISMGVGVKCMTFLVDAGIYLLIAQMGVGAVIYCVFMYMFDFMNIKSFVYGRSLNNK